MPTTLASLEGLPDRVLAVEQALTLIHNSTAPNQPPPVQPPVQQPPPVVQQPPVVQPPTVQPPVVQPPVVPAGGPVISGNTLTWTPATWAANGGHAVPFAKTDPVTFSLADGIYKNSFAFGGSWAPPARGASDAFTKFTLTSATRSWPPQVVFDSTDHAWGKAAILSFGKVDAVTRVAVGNATVCEVNNVAVHGITRSVSDGTAGIYGDINSMLYVKDCEISGNNDGIFANSACELLHVEDTLFGLRAPNEAPDFLSHNIYSNAKLTTVIRSIGYNGNANNFKFRGVGTVTVDQCWLDSANGRHTDRPDGGEIVVSNSVLVQRLGSASQNMFAMAEESQKNVTLDPKTGVMLYRNCDIWVEAPCAIMVGSITGVLDGSAPVSVVFENCRWHFIKSSDPTRLTHLAVAAKNGGTVVGLPFPIPPADASGTSLITLPESAFEAGPAPACPSNPADLPALLAAYLPGSIV